MKKNLIIIFVFAGVHGRAQVKNNQSPYEWEWVRDGIWTGAGLAAGITGYQLIVNKKDISEDQLNSLDKNDINFADRWLAGTYSKSAIGQSYVPFGLSFSAPVLMLFDDEINEHSAQILGLYLESLATTAAMYTITAGVVNRSRPYVYNSSGEVSKTKRLQNNGQRSFYSGHTAATATATFFAAKIYSDFHPDSPLLPYFWTGAAVLPAVVGYLRLEAGQHFLTDTLLGYALGAATGYFIPVLHKTENRALHVYPTSGYNLLGQEFRGLAFQFRF